MLSSPLAQAATATWTAGSGAWNRATNWNTGVVPGNTLPGGDSAIFGATVGTATTVTLDNGTTTAFSPTLNSLVVNSTGAATAGLVINPGRGGSLNMAAGATIQWNTGSGAVTTNTIAAGVVMKGGLTLNLAGSASSAPLTMSGVISDGGSGFGLTVAGTGTVLLTGANTYTGNTAVNSGTLQLNHAAGAALAGNLTVGGGTVTLLQSNQLASTKSVAVSSGTLNIGAFNNTVSGVTLTGGTISSTTGVLTSSSAYNVQAGTISARLGGTVGLNKTSAGTVTLSGANTFTGTTTVSAGTLNLNTTGAPALAGALAVTGGTVVLQQSNQLATTQNVTVSAGTLNIGASSNTVGGVQLTGSGTIQGTTGVLTSTSNYDVQSGTVSAVLGGTVGLNKSTAGTVTLSGANTFTGATTVSAGTLNLNTTGAPALAGALAVTGGTVVLQQSNQLATTQNVTVSAGTLNIGASSNTVGGVQLTGSGIIQGTTGVLTSTSAYDMQAGSVPAKLGGTVGLNKTGAGAVTLSASNTYSGTTAVSAGSLTLSALAGNAVAGDVSVSGGTLQLGLSNQIADGKSLTVSGGTFAIGANSETVQSVHVTGTGSITGSTGVLTANSAFDVQAGTVPAILGGSVGLNKTTTGTATLSGANTFSGPTTVSAGTLNLNTTGAPALSGALSITGGTVVLQQPNQLATTRSVTVSAGTLNIGANSNTVGSVQLTNGGTISSTTGVLTSASPYDMQSGTVTAILSGPVALNKTGSGTAVTLTRPNTYTGATNVTAGTLNLNSSNGPAVAGDTQVNGGTLVLQQSNQLPVSKNLTVSSGIVEMGGNSNTVAGAKITNGAIQSTTGTGTAVLTSSSNFDVQGGNISVKLAGAVGLNKTGSAAASLSAANTFTGTTTVTGGTLFLNTPGATALAGNVLVNGGSLSLQRSNQTSPAKTVTVSSGSFTLGQNNTTVGGLTVTGGTVSSATGILTSATAFDVQGGTISARLAGNVGLNKTGAGTATLSGNSTYTGDIQVSNGVLALNGSSGSTVLPGNLSITGGSVVLQQDQQLAATKTVTLSGGALDMGTSKATVAGLQLTGGSQVLGTGTLTSTTTFDLQNGTVNAVLGGTVGANVTSGTVTLAGQNTHTGLTHVLNGGTLLLNSASGPALVGDLTVESSGNVTLSQSNQTSPTRALAVTGGTVDLGAHNTTVGNLQLTSNGSILGTGVLTSNGGVFDLQSGTIKASLAGTSSVSISNGTVTLGGTNSYTGPTAISSGTLNLIGSTATASQVTITGGTLAGSGTVGGNVALSGSGAINLSGGTIGGALGTTGGSFSGVGTVTGAVTTNSGVFSITNNAVLTASSGVTVKGGTLAIAGTVAGNVILNNAGTITFSGAGSITQDLLVTGGKINGTGSVGGLSLVPQSLLTLGNGARLTLTNGGLNTVGPAGISTITGGTLVAGSGGFKVAGTGTLNIASNLSSSGGLIKTGSGTLWLKGTSTLGGSTEIHAGTLTLDGTLITPELDLFAGTTFNGSGTLLGTLVNLGGTFNPGHSPGTLTISGNYTQTTKGTLVLQVQNANVHDRLIVGGTATLAGTLAVQNWNGHQFSYGDQVTGFIQAARIVGQFSQVTMPTPDLRGRIVNDGHNLTLLAAPASYTLLAHTPNQLQVARALDRWIGHETGDVGVVTLALDVQRAAQYPAAFNAIGPAYYSVLPQVGIEEASAQASMMQQRFAEIHSKVQHATIAEHSTPAGASSTPAATASHGSSSGKAPLAASPATFASEEEPWTAWMQLSGQFAQFQTLQSLADNHFDTAGALAGLDHRLGQESAAGVTVGYNYTHLGYNAGEHTSIDTGRVTLYAAAGLGNGYFLDTTVGGGYTNYDVQRPVQFSFIDRIARGRTDGSELSAAVQFGKEFRLKNWTVTPRAGFQYTRVHVNGLNETDAGALNLAVNGYGAQSMRSTLGVQVAYQAKLSDKVTIIPYLTAGWQHEFDSPPETVRAALPADGGGSFRYNGSSLGLDRMQTGAGVMLNVGEDTSLNLGYQAEFGSGDYESHMIMLMLSYRF